MKRWRTFLSGLCAMAVIVAALLAPAAYAAPAPAQPAQDPTPAPALPLPPASDDWERVQAAKTLVVGTAADYEPFEFYNSNFELDGFDIALMQELGKRMGVNVVFQDFAFSGLLDALNLGQVDAAISAISVTPERREKVDFSNLYYVGDDVVLAGKSFTGTVANPADLAGLKIGGIRILDPDCVGKTYPGYWDALRSLGVSAVRD
jgi:polar amino acid transport system substrate-binding protein